MLPGHLETFFANIEMEGQYLPRHVEKNSSRLARDTRQLILHSKMSERGRDFLKCGVLAHGFVRMRCNDCGRSMVVGFSCKGRGFCPSCTGRRMADTSARLVDDTFPENAPVRQWVLSLPIQIRYRLAHDGKLLSDVLRIFLRVVNGWYRKQAKTIAIRESLGGSVTFAQRFGSALNLNPHFHAAGCGESEENFS